LDLDRLWFDYFALGKLSEEGLIENGATEKAGNRPSRSVYQITEAGRAEFPADIAGGMARAGAAYFPSMLDLLL